MHPRFCGLILGMILATASSCGWAQDDALLEKWKNLKVQAETTSPDSPRLEVFTNSPEVAMYVAEHRNRMIWQLIGFVFGLAMLHLIQVKLKIHRGYFWFVVGGVILGMVLSSYRPTTASAYPTDRTEPTYAPTHAR